jgi:hypothetical protein
MALQRPLKEGSVRTYQEKVGLGFLDILASEVDADCDTIYAAWNGTLGGDLTGTLPNPTVAAAAKSKWTVSGATLTPTDATKTVTLVTPLTLRPSGRTTSARLVPYPSAETAYFTANRYLDTAGTTWLSDDATKSSWVCVLDPQSDQVRFARAPAGSPNVGTALLTLDNAGNLTVPGTYIALGSTTSRIQMAARGSILADGNILDFYYNDAAGPAYVQANPGWLYRIAGGAAGDVVQWLHRSGGVAGYDSTPMILYAGGNLTINGATATKATGTTWANPSDIRLKRDVAPYAHGLADILQLEPISYTLKATEQQTCGLDAAQVQAVFPECVGTTRMKLQPEDEEETEVLTLDIHPILIALINAVKELAGRVSPVPQPT